MNASATEVKTRFGEFMDKAQREPVTVDKGGRNYAVLLSFEEYQRLLALEDAIGSPRRGSGEVRLFWEVRNPCAP